MIGPDFWPGLIIFVGMLLVVLLMMGGRGGGGGSDRGGFDG